MYKIAILEASEQLAEALGTQFQPIYAICNDRRPIITSKQVKSSDRVIFLPYSGDGLGRQTIELLRLIKDISPDIVYINSLRHLLTIGLLVRISNTFGTRPLLIATSHNSKLWTSTERLLIAFLLNSFADGVVALAKSQEQWLREYGISAFKTRNISNAVDTQLFSPDMTEMPINPPDSPVLINVAGLRPIKSQDILIRAVGLVKEEFPSVKLILMGGQSYSEYERYLEELIVDCHLQDNVISVGNTDHRKIPQLLRSSDISLMSSLSEVCPYAVLESLATGKVTIATPVGGVPDLITHEFNGFLVKPGDFKGFADCILRVLNDQSLRTRIERNARQSAESNFSYEIIGEKYREFISVLMHQRAGQSINN